MTSATTTRRAGIIGWPVEHSKSPVVHSYWLDHYSVEGSYVRLPVRPKELADALNSLAQRGFVGINITLPHKERALEFVDEVSPEAQRIGAANTIFVNERGRLLATNTDAYGFLANLRAEAPEFDVAEAPAVVVGAGGASRAVCVALQDAGVPEIYLVNRTESRAESIAESLGGNVKVISWNERSSHLHNAGLLVNTTSLGMTGQPKLEMDIGRLSGSGVVADIVYSPLETPLLAAAHANGLRTVDGLGMLLYQAQAGFEGWFGKKPAVTPSLRQHILSAS
ncbi:MAG: shikimate dehydrogenase [Candidatus Marinimicrobia bacterium]|nr:shikimate dehydrogenase [Candidatus Neomarinimicrobiota bacterium]